MEDSGIGKISCSYGVSRWHIKNASTGMRRTSAGEDRVDNSSSLMKIETDGSIVLNFMKHRYLSLVVYPISDTSSNMYLSNTFGYLYHGEHILYGFDLIDTRIPHLGYKHLTFKIPLHFQIRN